MKPEARRRERSRTYAGIAEAMAEQWTQYIHSLERSPS